MYGKQIPFPDCGVKVKKPQFREKIPMLLCLVRECPHFRWKSKNWSVKVYHAASKTKVLKIGFIGQKFLLQLKNPRSGRLGQKLSSKGKSSKVWVLRSKIGILGQNLEIRVCRWKVPFLGWKCLIFEENVNIFVTKSGHSKLK